MSQASKSSRYLHAFLGMGLAFLVGLGAMAAQDKAAKPEHGAAHAQAQAPATGDKPYAPGLPGWIKHLPADKQEIAGKIWLAEGRSYMALKKMVKAKRLELDALVAMPGSDDKAVQALVKDIASYEEKALTAEVALKRKLEKEGIPFWGHGEHGMMGGSMMEGKSCPMMGGGKGGMMKGGDKDGGDKPKDGGHSGH